MNSKITEIIQQFHTKHILPINKIALEKSIDNLYNILFPICINVEGNRCDDTLKEIYQTLLINFQNIETLENPSEKVDSFFEQLPLIQETLYEDAKAFYKNDPASYSIEEVILSYPGFYALAVHRLANVLYKMNIPIIPRLWAEYAHTKGGIDIHPGATIGKRFFLDHGTGVVIGETCIIGNDVKIYQNVTLGALHVTKDMQSKKRHPTVEDNVIIYSGATILGGETVIGHDSTIGGNVWLTKSVEPFSLIYYTSQLKHKTIKDYIEPINFVI
ncbi:serine O-acetyltransferase [Flavobacteriaceae bacterium UJ101]|nr:serine O-acetyltransferase [Flavobacteriaceae bacterium UJ101]